MHDEDVIAGFDGGGIKIPPPVTRSLRHSKRSEDRDPRQLESGRYLRSGLGVLIDDQEQRVVRSGVPGERVAGDDDSA